MNWLANLIQVGESETASHWFSTPLEIILAMALIISLCFGFRYLKRSAERKLLSLEQSITDSAVKIEAMHDSILDSSTPKLRPVRREEIVKQVTQVGKKIDDVGDEVTTRCGTLSCPVVPAVTRELADIKKDLSHFCEEGRRSREETQKLIGSIFDRISSFVDSVGAKMMELLERMAERKER